MTWFRVDDGFHKHRKRRSAGLEAIGMWTVCGSWTCDAGSDGFIPELEAAGVGGAKWRRIVNRLIESGLWEHATHDGESGYLMHDYTDYNPTRASLEADKESTRERVQKWREERRGNAVTPPVPNGDVQTPHTQAHALKELPPTPAASGRGFCDKTNPTHPDCRNCGTNRRAVSKQARDAVPVTRCAAHHLVEPCISCAADRKASA